MRDLLGRGVRTVGIDCFPEHEGFRSKYGKSYLCPNPDTNPAAWVRFMVDLARTLGSKPVIIPAADLFVSALGRHAAALSDHYIFSVDSVAVQATLATKEQQYALAAEHGFPIPRTVYVKCRADIEQFIQDARFPCLIKPRHQREWEVLPEGNPLRGLKIVTASDAQELLARYALTENYRPEVIAQEIIAGGDDAKYCYLSVYGAMSRRLAYCVVRELRAYPILFGSASLVEPVIDEEIACLCDSFLSRIGYVGICEIEVKRDTTDNVVRLIEANPRFSVTADAAIYAGVEMGWLHYLDLIGRDPKSVEPSRFGFRHVTLRRDIASLPRYIEQGILSWQDIRSSYQGPLEFYDFDAHDPRPTAATLQGCIRVVVGTVLRALKLKPKLTES